MESNQVERAEEIKSCIYDTMLNLNSNLKELYLHPIISAENDVLIFAHLFYHIKSLENDTISQNLYKNLYKK
jgi:hypothetical protein